MGSQAMDVLPFLLILFARTISSAVPLNTTSIPPTVNNTQSSNRISCIPPVHNIDRPIESDCHNLIGHLETLPDAYQEKTFQRRPVQYGNFQLPHTFRSQTCYITLSLAPNCPRDRASLAELAMAAETGSVQCLHSVFPLYSGAIVPSGRDRMILVVVHEGMISEDQLNESLTSNRCPSQKAALLGDSSAPSVTGM